MERIITVKESHYGVVVLDVDKVIALVPDKRMILFESVYWVLDQEDFDRVSEIWYELKKTKRMKHLTKQETVEALKELFDYENNKESKNVLVVENKEEGRTTFIINKQHMERSEVIDKLQEFFADNVINGGQCRVDNITLVFTVFFIEKQIKAKRMKSIREKVQTDYPKSDILEEEMTRICYRVGFEKGANYVLDAITDVINQPMNDYLVLGELKKVILQLKK